MPRHFLISKKFSYFLVFLFSLLFFLRAYVGLDPDLGWHLAVSKIMTTQAFPAGDPFSYMMPSHPYINHEWLLHTILYPLYEAVGIAGIALLWTGIVVALLVLCIMLTPSFVQVPMLLLGSVLLTRFGIRAQVISWLLSFLLFIFITDQKRWRKYRFFVPLLFLFWANIHGSILLAVILFSLFIFLRPRNLWKRGDFAVWIISLLVTLINPYGVLLWKEIIQQINQPLVHQHIQEWNMFFYRPELSHIFSITIIAFFFWKYRIPQLRYERIITIFLCLLSFSAIRHIPYLLLWLSFYIPQGFLSLQKEVSTIKGGPVRLLWFYKMLIGVCIALCMMESVLAMNAALTLREGNFYPKRALQWLSQKEFTGNVFSLYEWGGYLDWKFPLKKVFIDGRMPHMKWDAPHHESSYAFADYLSIMEGNDVEYSRKKYAIEYMLLRKPAMEGSYPSLLSILQKKKQRSIYDQLQDDAWQVVYEDDVSIIYHKELLSNE